MKGELKPGEAMPSMRKLAKSLARQRHHDAACLRRSAKRRIYHHSSCKGNFVSTPNQDFIREENLRRIEELLTDAATLGRENGLSLEELQTTLELVYKED